ncbi:hypothetical protein A0H81_02610 [Grifola frondosa]|uniref:Uncharacterized protein n=1 Tax=Grifola frondosa TaxID=5627 RepID=A0A1C7MNL2_GRIFR|nr:hypothetical protein A0H81_02610 [Grifola frondosa]
MPGLRNLPQTPTHGVSPSLSPNQSRQLTPMHTGSSMSSSPSMALMPFHPSGSMPPPMNPAAPPTSLALPCLPPFVLLDMASAGTLFDGPLGHFVHVLQGLQEWAEQMTDWFDQLQQQYTDCQNELTRVQDELKGVRDEVDAALDSQGITRSGHRKGKAAVSSNDHPEVKALLHTMLWRLVDVPRDDYKMLSKCTLANPGEYTITCDDGKTIWYPNFLTRIDDPINREFITMIAQLVYENEKVSLCREQKGDQGILPYILDKPERPGTRRQLR